jgi:Polyketide cyclase / dehydrase and lipid transport
MQITAKASRGIACSLEQAFNFMTKAENLPDVFLGYGPLPAIRRAEFVGRAEPRVGAVRRIENVDDSVVNEEILAHEPPALHRYRLVGDPPLPLRLLVRGLAGEWRFSPHRRDTVVGWSYSLELTTPLAWPLVLVVRGFLRRAMKRGLDNVALTLDRAARRAPQAGPPRSAHGEAAVDDQFFADDEARIVRR